MSTTFSRKKCFHSANCTFKTKNSTSKHVEFVPEYIHRVISCLMSVCAMYSGMQIGAV